MKLFFCSLLFISSQTLFAQDVYPLHPSIGDTIELEEKLDYSLFASTPNEGFQFATIAFINSGFVLLTNRIEKLPNGLIKVFTDSSSLSQDEIIFEQQKIQKINNYYKYLAEEAKKPKKQEYKILEKKIPVRFDGPISESLKKETRMKARLIEDHRRMEEFQMGLRPREMRIELSR